jgi:hypothetical protein
VLNPPGWRDKINFEIAYLGKLWSFFVMSNDRIIIQYISVSFFPLLAEIVIDVILGGKVCKHPLRHAVVSYSV